MIFFSKFFNSNLKEIVTPLFGTNYWIGFLISFFLISSLFIFRGFYAKVSKHNGFRYVLGTFQFLIYVLYYLFHQLSHDITWKDYLPFQLCSFLNLTSAFLLIFPREKLFSITFPLIGPVVLAFFLPDVSKRVYGLDSFFFYQYYLNHTIIFFSYFYLYFYGHIEYDKFLVKQTCIFLTIFSLFIFTFNVIFITNYLFIGEAGFSFSDKYWFLSTSNWYPVFRFLFMWIVGLFFILLFNFLISKYAPPFYFESGKKINEYYQKKLSFFSKIRNKIKSIKKEETNLWS